MRRTTSIILQVHRPCTEGRRPPNQPQTQTQRARARVDNGAGAVYFGTTGPGAGSEETRAGGACSGTTGRGIGYGASAPWSGAIVPDAGSTTRWAVWDNCHCDIRSHVDKPRRQAEVYTIRLTENGLIGRRLGRRTSTFGMVFYSVADASGTTS